jgi:hypothetical protein
MICKYEQFDKSVLTKIRQFIYTEVKTLIEHGNVSELAKCIEFTKKNTKSKIMKAINENFDYKYDNKVQVLYKKCTSRNTPKFLRCYPLEYF